MNLSIIERMRRLVLSICLVVLRLQIQTTVLLDGRIKGSGIHLLTLPQIQVYGLVLVQL